MLSVWVIASKQCPSYRKTPPPPEGWWPPASNTLFLANVFLLSVLGPHTRMPPPLLRAVLSEKVLELTVRGFPHRYAPPPRPPVPLARLPMKREPVIWTG